MKPCKTHSLSLSHSVSIVSSLSFSLIYRILNASRLCNCGGASGDDFAFRLSPFPLSSLLLFSFFRFFLSSFVASLRHFMQYYHASLSHSLALLLSLAVPLLCWLCVLSTCPFYVPCNHALSYFFQLFFATSFVFLSITHPTSPF